MKSTIPSRDLLNRIQRWVTIAQASDVADSSSPEDWLRRAATLKDRIRGLNEGDPYAMAELVVEAACHPPDIYHALAELLDRDRDSGCPGRATELNRTYEVAAAVAWDDEVGEKHQILARLAFLSWDHWRRRGAYRDAKEWQTRCVSHVLQQEHTRDYLNLGTQVRTAAVDRRFLSDEPVLLTVYASVTGERTNREPAVVRREAEALYRWLIEDGVASGLREELMHFLASGTAISAAVAESQLGRDRSRQELLALATNHAQLCSGSGPFRASIEQVQLINLYQDRAYAEVKLRIPALINELCTLGMHDKAVRASLLHGRTLKECGEHEEGLRVLQRVHADCLKNGDFLTAALALCDRAEMLNSRGALAQTMAAWNEAIDLADRSGCRWVVANVQGTLGEILRDNGQIPASIEAYSASVRSYEALEMRFLAAYTRIVLAEVLLMVNLPSRAVVEILTALPIIEKQDLTQEAAAAIGILREAVRRQQPGADAVRQLRAELRNMQAEGRL